MFKFTIVEDVDTLVKMWKRLLVLARENGPDVEPDQLLRMVLRCIECGVVFLVRGNTGLIGFVCVEQTGRHSATLRSIPREQVTGLGKTCLEAVKVWATEEGIKRVFVTTRRFSGSNFKYFRTSLGFRQYSVTLSMEI